MELLELINLTRERINTIYADTKSDIQILIAYLVNKKIIDLDDCIKFFEKNKDTTTQFFETRIQEMGKDDENEQED